MFQIDLTYIPPDWKQPAGRRGGFRYVVFLIDVFTRKLYGKLLRNKTQQTVNNAVRDLQPLMGRIRGLQSDNGNQFNSLRARLRRENTKVFNSATYTPQTQGRVERLNKTFKVSVQHWLDQVEDREFTEEDLANFIESYNDTYHDAIRMTPNQSDAQNDNRVREVEFDPPEFQIGDRVRVANKIFDAEYRKKMLTGQLKKSISQNWTYDVFTIARMNRLQGNKKQTYILRDPDGELVRKRVSPSDLMKA